VVNEDVLEAEVLAWRPAERLSPSVFSERHRYLKEGTTARPGRFSFEGFGFMRSIVDTIEEAIASGRRWVFMKPAQIGGSEIVISGLAWLQTFHAGPTLYMTSTDDVAKEFSRDRLSYACETCEPLAEKFLPARGGRDEIYVKRFVDGKIAICGGKSINHFQSHPYRNVLIDEADSLAELAGAGDPIKLADLRTAAYAIFGSTFVGAFAHPSTKEGPVGRLYYKESDQRRSFVVCPHCSQEFWLKWPDVKVLARDGQSPAAAERDPTCYRYVTPCCGVELPDHERLEIAQHAKQKSTLPPEVARSKPWIGVHISHLYTKPLLELARDWIEGLDNPSVRRVSVNKVHGDVFEQAETHATVETWQRLRIAEGEPGAYKIGTVPRGVQWLTAGQDSRQTELHWAVWGWGLAATEAGHQVLRGWLVDYGVEPGPAREDRSRTTLHVEDLEVFDQVLYARLWPSAEGTSHYAVGQAFHDSGWQPIAAYEYCRRFDVTGGRAIPSKGLPTDDRSRAPVIGWGAPPRWRIGGEEVSDPNLRRADLNTYVLKLDLTGLPSKTFRDEQGVPRSILTLPHDVTAEFLDHLASERLVLEKGKRFWKKLSHANHWWDCTVLAYAAALNTAPASPTSATIPTSPPEDRPPEDGWWSGSRGGSWKR
jgi:phage terminase large subunit GpA-like protein